MTHWDNQAKQWTLLGAPLKPSCVDIQNNSLWVHQTHSVFDKGLNVLVLGVTPEIINMPWPDRTTLFAVDYSLPMLKNILPLKTLNVKPIPLLGNWLHLPLPNSSIDVVIGDGCYSSIAASDYLNLSQEIQRILTANGTFIIRFFSRPEKNESLEQIHQDLVAGAENNFHAFKLRLAMALHKNLSQGVCLKTVWEYWSHYFRENVQKYKQKLRWDNDLIDTINTYKNTEAFYTFPTFSEIRAALDHHFIESDLFIPDYPLGTCCPSFKLTPKTLS